MVCSFNEAATSQLRKPAATLLMDLEKIAPFNEAATSQLRKLMGGYLLPVTPGDPSMRPQPLSCGNTAAGTRSAPYSALQ